MQGKSSTNRRRLEHEGYRLEASIPDGEAISLLQAVLREQYRVVTLLKDSRHCWVARVVIGERDLVLKKPRARNSRAWERFLTLFRDGESIRRHRSIALLDHLGGKGPEPIMGAERREAGRVVDGFFLYGFVEGRQASSRDIRTVARALLRLHEQGYLHGDAQLQNAIINEGQAYFIDFKTRRPRFLTRMRLLMEYSKFLESAPLGYRYLDREVRDSRAFRLANNLQAGCSCLRRWRKAVKRRLAARHK